MLAFWLGNYRLEYKICVLAELTRLFITAAALCTTLTAHSLRVLSVLTVYQNLAGKGLFCHLPIKCFLHVDNTYLPFRLKDPRDTTIAMCSPHCTTGIQRQWQLKIVSSIPAPFCALLQEDLNLTSSSRSCISTSAQKWGKIRTGCHLWKNVSIHRKHWSLELADSVNRRGLLTNSSEGRDSSPENKQTKKIKKETV